MIRYSVSGIVYKSCKNTEPWEANVLLSPVTNISTDSLLKFNLSTERRGSLDVYATSQVGHIAFRLATFATTVEEKQLTYMDSSVANFSSVAFAVMSICIPRTTEKLAFVASALPVKDSHLLQPDVMIKDVLLTDTPCTAPTLTGKSVVRAFSTLGTILLKFYWCQSKDGL